MGGFRPIHIVFDDRCQLHNPPLDHPEGPNRTHAIMERMKSSVLRDVVTIVPSRMATMDELTLVHDANYILAFEEACLSGREYMGHKDNAICYETFEAALVAAGGGLQAIDLIEAGEAERVFCCTRPPGHHAEPASPLGFCFINNCALAARYWQERHGVEKVVIFDFDAHHGNGIETIFFEDPSVLYISINEHPAFSFPGTGYGEDRGGGRGEGLTLNIPLMPGAGEQEVMDALKAFISPALERFSPDALVVAAGFDAHEMDDMSGLAYTTKVFGKLGVAARLWADSFCSGRLVAILEGGYQLDALAASCERFLGGLSLEC